MELITDLKMISKFADELEDENWRLRAYLKGYDIEIEELDALVYSIYKDVSSKIDCTKCSNCCREIKPLLDDKDIIKFANALKIEVSEFKAKFVIEDEEEEGKFNFNKLPCPFLKDSICINYKNRPKDCESYPHLHKEEFIFRLWNVIEQYGVCPIVFNVFEILKGRVWNKRTPYFDGEIDTFDY